MTGDDARKSSVASLARVAAIASAKAALIAVPLLLLLMVLNYAGTFVDRAPVRARVLDAFASGQLIREPFGERTGIGDNQWNDCLILYMTVRDDGGTQWSRALGPHIPREEGANPCAKLQDYVNARASGGEPEPIGPGYDRYLHAQTAFAPFFVGVMPLETVRMIFSFVTLANALALFGYACWFVAKAGRKNCPNGASRGTFVAVAAACLLLFFQYNKYGMSLSHFPSDMVLSGYLWFALLVSFERQSKWLIVGGHAVFGVLTAWTEFLTGGLPLGICLIAYMFAANAGGLQAGNAGKNALAGLTAFIVAFIISFLAKIGLSALINEGSAGMFMSTLTRRMAGQVTDLPAESKYTFAAMLRGFWWGAGRVGVEWTLLGRSLIFLSFAAIAAGVVIVIRRRLRSTELIQPGLLVLAFASICAWHVAFYPHTANHDWMIRTLVGLYFPALMLIACLYRVQLSALARSASAMLAPQRP